MSRLVEILLLINCYSVYYDDLRIVNTTANEAVKMNDLINYPNFLRILCDGLFWKNPHGIL